MGSEENTRLEPTQREHSLLKGAALPLPESPEIESRGFIHDLFDELENNANIHRRIIDRLEDLLDRTVVLYVANPGHPGAHIQDHDVNIFESTLRSVDLDKYDEKVDLILDSPGGMPYAAEKIVRIFRAYADDFRVVIPSQAMSAATLISLGADEIVMSPTSKMGPIDPQMVYQTDSGTTLRPAKSFVEAYQELVRSTQQAVVNDTPPDPFLHQLSQTDLSWVIECARAREATETIAQDLLKLSMMEGEDDEEVEAAVEEIIELGEQVHHGRPFYYGQADDLGLEVEEMDLESEEWEAVWELFVRAQRHANSNGLAKYICTRQGGLDLQLQVKSQ